MSEALIRLSDLHFTYNAGSDRAMAALRGIDLEIYPGECVAIIGHNGSGKSTLARQLNALLLPTAGDVWVKGMNTKDMALHREIRRTVAMVFQNPENQIVATVVQEDVAFGPENLGVPEEQLRKRVQWAMEVTGITELRFRAPHRLSAGQKQRLALAGALAMQPECLVLDEATAMLDPAGRRAVWEIIQQLCARGMAVVVITQRMAEASRAARIVVLSSGQMALTGPPREIFAQESELLALGLDLPPITRLSRMLHARVPEFPANLLTASELITHLRIRSTTGGGHP